MRLILVRHALPERVRPDGSGSAAADPGLTARGREQAESLVPALARDEVDALYASPLRRARETAAPLATASGRSPRLLEGLREYDADAAGYVPVHEMARVDPSGWERMRAGLLPAHVDTATFAARVTDTLEAIVAAHPGVCTAVVVAHAGVIDVYLAGLLGIDRPLAFPLDYAGITRVQAGRDGRRVVRSVNETGHVAHLLPVP